jgi:photosystem II stability/assembly factor-like uncharacterized protein
MIRTLMKIYSTISILLCISTLLFGQGTAWHEQESGVETDLSLVFALDSMHVWAAGDEAILLRTTNGGINWENCTIPYTAKCMHFFNTHKGIIAGANSQVLLTVDGGISWDLVPTGVLASYTGMSFTDSLNGWLTGNGNQVIVRTRDGGQTWQNLSIGNSERFLIDVGFADTNKGWVLCRNYDIPHNHHVMVTNDGGNSWTTLYSWPFNPDYIIYQFYDLCVTDSMNIWICGYMWEYYFTDGGVVWNSSNGGEDWEWYMGDYYSVFSSIHFPDADHGWVAGWKRIFHLYPPEQETSLQYEDPSEIFVSIHFADSLHGWAAGSSGAIVYTSNGGIVSLKDIRIETEPGLKLFPNPCTAKLHCELNTPCENLDLLITDIYGNLMIDKHIRHRTSLLEISTENFDPGVYILSLKYPSGHSDGKKFIVE